jgi:hypothetical protein
LEWNDLSQVLIYDDNTNFLEENAHVRKDEAEFLLQSNKEIVVDVNLDKGIASFETFMAVMFRVDVLCVVTSCSVTYQNTTRRHDAEDIIDLWTKELF